MMVPPAVDTRRLPGISAARPDMDPLAGIGEWRSRIAETADRRRRGSLGLAMVDRIASGIAHPGDSTRSATR